MSTQPPGTAPPAAYAHTAQTTAHKPVAERLHSKRPVDGAAPSTGASAGPMLDCRYASAAGERRFRLYRPSGYTGRPVPLIVMLHGGTQNGTDFAAVTNMNAHADRHTFLVAYPEQPTSANSMRFWNWFRPADQRRGAGEPSLIAGITRQISADHAVDTARRYIAGFSAGGAMAAVMATTYPDLYAAVGVHSGLAHGAAHDTRSAISAMNYGPSIAHPPGGPAIPLMVIHGDHDPTVHHRNADRLVEAALAAPGAQSTPLHVHTTDNQVPGGRRYTRTVYTAAMLPIIEQLTIHQGGHAWSGGPSGPHTDPLGPDACAELVRFFQQHASGTARQLHGRHDTQVERPRSGSRQAAATASETVRAKKRAIT